MRLFLDDVREPWLHGCIGFEWVKTADEAIELLKTGKVTFASLDHDLAWEHYPQDDIQDDPTPKEYKEKTGLAVVEWMRDNNVWPVDGVVVHSMNPVGRKRMQHIIDQHYLNAE